MQVFLESIGELGHRIEVHIPRQKITEQVEKEFARVSKHASLPGFRKGQVPKKVLWERYAGSLRADIVEKMIDETLPQAIKQKDLNVVGGIVLEKVEDQDDQDLRYVLTVEVRPPVALTPFSVMQIAQPVVEISDKDIHDAIDAVRQEQAKWHDVTNRTVVAMGDRVKMLWTDLSAESVAIGDADELTVHLTPALPVELTNALVGQAVNAVVNVRFSMPRSPNEIHAKVEILAIQEKAALSDQELLDHFSGRFENWDALLNEVRRSLQESADKMVREEQEEAVFDALLAHNTLNLPPRLLEREKAEMKREVKDLQELEALAKKRLMLGFLVSAIVEKYALKLDHDAISRDARAFGQYMQTQGQSDKKKFSEKEHKTLIARMEHAALLKSVVDAVLKEATLLSEPVAYADFMKAMHAKRAEDSVQETMDVDHAHEHVHDEHCNHAHHDHD